jgi:MSHA pilin protein MshD
MSVTRPSARGVSLVELVVFIVIVGVAMAGVFAAFNTMTARSADPQVRKQVLAIAESLMDEIAQMPFSYCDPDDPAAATATGTGDCATAEGIGVEGGETRYSTTTRFDNVSDYDTFAMASGIQDITNSTISGLSAYSATVAIAQVALASGANLVPATESLRISVTVSGPGGVSITLEGYRTRYAPNALP